MNDNIESADKEPTTTSAAGLLPETKPASALSGISRSLTEDELSSSGARKLIIDRLDKAEMEIIQLREFEAKYHDADKQVAILTEKAAKTNSFEFLYGATLVLGSIFAGLSPSVWDKQPYGWLSLLAGIGLVIGAVVTKGVRK
ncbi:MAG TPA: hypothetical protein PKI10_15785 [Syntrophorhabdus sp.]|nr:hypothetical protein [Syntrophorhabdus sp.]